MVTKTVVSRLVSETNRDICLFETYSISIFAITLLVCPNSNVFWINSELRNIEIDTCRIRTKELNSENERDQNIQNTAVECPKSSELLRCTLHCRIMLGYINCIYLMWRYQGVVCYKGQFTLYTIEVH